MSGRIIVGMSGGVDSSVAALRLIEAGNDVHGLYMSNWTEDEEGYCTAAEDYADALAVARHLGIPLHKVDFSAQYRDQVFSYFLSEYDAGRTPNPDVLCNREIKFGVFLDYARRLGATRIATGHYARIDRDGDRVRLLKGIDAGKDQSYFLHAVGVEALRQAEFPLGDLRKDEVRALARRHGLPTAAKKDSTGICFIGERDFRAFLARFLPARPGDMATPEGETIGRHEGLMYYTLGQRQGLGLGGRAGTGGEAWYVVGKDLDRNRLIVAQGHDHPLLFSAALESSPVHWLEQPDYVQPFRCTAKTRYRQADQTCRVTLRGDTATVHFDRPQRAVTPGQFAVFYDGDVCLGGGPITTTEPVEAAREVAAVHPKVT